MALFKAELPAALTLRSTFSVRSSAPQVTLRYQPRGCFVTEPRMFEAHTVVPRAARTSCAPGTWPSAGKTLGIDVG